MVQGSACTRTTRHPDCTFQGGEPPPGKLFVIDLARLLGADFRACADADYEDWAAPAPGTCLLGRRLTLTRRRADAAQPRRRGGPPRATRGARVLHRRRRHGVRVRLPGRLGRQRLLRGAAGAGGRPPANAGATACTRLAHPPPPCTATCVMTRAPSSRTRTGRAARGEGRRLRRRGGGGRWGWLHTLFFVLLITGEKEFSWRALLEEKGGCLFERCAE